MKKTTELGVRRALLVDTGGGGIKKILHRQIKLKGAKLENLIPLEAVLRDIVCNSLVSS